MDLLESISSDDRLRTPRPVPADGRPARGDRRAHRRAGARRQASGAARRDRHRQDVHHGQRHRRRPAADAGDGAQQDAGRPALRRVQGVLPRQRRRVLRLATTTTTSRKPTSPRTTCTSRRRPRSTKRSTGCGCRPRPPSLSRRDVVIVASVSCIYGIGSPEAYGRVVVQLQSGEQLPAQRGAAPAGGDPVRAQRHGASSPARSACAATRWKSCPAYGEHGLRIAFFGDEIERIVEFDPLTGEMLAERDEARHLSRPSTSSPRKRSCRQALADIETELRRASGLLQAQDKLLEAQRLEQRTRYDLEMLREVGYCSRHRELLAPPRPAAAAARRPGR